MDSCSLVVSHILAELRPERATYKTLDLLNGLSKFAQNFTVGFLKLLSTHQSTLLFGEPPLYIKALNAWYMITSNR